MDDFRLSPLKRRLIVKRSFLQERLVIGRCHFHENTVTGRGENPNPGVLAGGNVETQVGLDPRTVHPVDCPLLHGLVKGCRAAKAFRAGRRWRDGRLQAGSCADGLYEFQRTTKLRGRSSIHGDNRKQMRWNTAADDIQGMKLPGGSSNAMMAS